MALVKCYGSMMSMLPHSPSTELISSDGEFKEAGFENFVKFAKLQEHGLSYVAIAIIGQQSTGKSTLMNHLFGTNFKEMAPDHGRSATTKGIWMAKASLMEPLTIALDLEGTDSRERREDDKTFERQSALFAAVVADVLIINMNCQNVGQDQGGNRPLLKIIFEAMTHLFGPHKITLLFVLRNIKEVSTSFEKLESELREDVEKIWKTALKPPGHENTPLTQIINVEVAALPSYLSAPAIFTNEVTRLRSRLYDSIFSPRQHDGVSKSEVISFSRAKILWDNIKGYKDLDLPSLKVMVATVRCEEIARNKLRLLQSDKDWLALEEAAASSLVSDFNIKITTILDIYLSQYDMECIRYENDVSIAKREYLMSEASKVVHPAYMNTLNHRRSDALQSFDNQLKAALSGGGGFAESVQTCKQSCELQFDEQCGSDDAKFSNSSDVSAVRHEFLHDIENNSLLVRAQMLLQIVDEQQERLSTKFSKEIKYFLNDNSDDDVWGRIRSMLRSESDAAALALPSAVADFELDQSTLDKMVEDLKQSAKELVVKKFKEETDDVLTLLKQRFVTALIPTNSEASNEIEEVIQPTKEDAFLKCVKLLSTMAVIRLDEREGDPVESMLLSTLMAAEDDQNSTDHLDSLTWEEEEEEVPPTMTLITPVRCREIWNQHKQEMEQHHANTMLLHAVANHWGPLNWVILGILVLGASAGFVSCLSTDAYVVRAADVIARASIIVDATQGAIVLWKNMSEAVGSNEYFISLSNLLAYIKEALRKLLSHMHVTRA